MKIRRKVFVILLAIFAVFCGICLWLLNFNGPGVSPDSVLYLDLAKNLSFGVGFETVLDESSGISLSPPFYPLVLSFFLRMGFADLFAVRLLNAFLFSSTIFVIGLNFVQENNCKCLGFISLLLLVSNKIVLFCFSMLWTESLFVFMLVLTFYFLSRFIEKGYLHWLFFSAIFASAAFFTRYAGITVIITCCVAIFFLYDGRFFNRFRLIGIFVILSSLVPLLWVFFVLYFSEFSLGAHTVFHFPSFGHWRGLVRTFLSLFIPETILNIIKEGVWVQISFTITFVIFLIFSLWMFFRKAVCFDKALDSFKGLYKCLKIFFFFLCIYPVFIFFSVLFFDFTTPFDERISLPFLLAFFVVTPFFLYGFVKKSRFTYHKFTLIFASVIALFFVNSLFWGITFFREGFGYSSLWWRGEGDWKRFILRGKGLFYSNDKNAIYFVGGIVPIELPRKILSYTNEENPNYEIEMSKLKDDLKINRGTLIFFHNKIADFTYPSKEELEKKLSDAEKIEFDKVSIYMCYLR